MDDTASVTQLAHKLGQSAFESSFAGVYFLVKRRSVASVAAADEEVPISYRTTHVHVNKDMLDAHDVFGAGLRIWKIEKRPDNPYPDRIGVGRAPNCDIVIRAPYLSKLHAHFAIREGRLMVSDNRSANGTSLNGTKLEAGNVMPVKSGDRIDFGGIELEVLDAPALFALLS